MKLYNLFDIQKYIQRKETEISTESSWKATHRFTCNISQPPLSPKLMTDYNISVEINRAQSAGDHNYKSVLIQFHNGRQV